MTWTPCSAGCFVLQRMTCTIHAAQCIMASAAPSLTLWMRGPGARPLVLCQRKKEKKNSAPRRMALSLEASRIEEGQFQVWISSITMWKKDGCTQYWQEVALCTYKINQPHVNCVCVFCFVFLSNSNNKQNTSVAVMCKQCKRNCWLGSRYIIPFSLECTYMSALLTRL